MEKKIVDFTDYFMGLGLTPVFLENPGFIVITDYLEMLLNEVKGIDDDYVVVFKKEKYSDSIINSFSFDLAFNKDKSYSFSLWSNIDNSFAYELKEKFRKENSSYDKYYQGKVMVDDRGELTFYDAVSLVTEYPVVKLESVATKKVYNGYGVVEYLEKRAFNRDVYGINKIYNLEENMAIELFDGGTYENLWYEKMEISRVDLVTAEVTSSKKNMYKGIDVTCSILPLDIESGLSEIVLSKDINDDSKILELNNVDKYELIRREKNIKVQEGLKELNKRNKVLVR